MGINSRRILFSAVCFGLLASGMVDRAEAMLLGTVRDPATDIATLVEIDPATGNLVRTIGSVGYRVTGLEYMLCDDKLYATTSSSDPVFQDGLLEINMTTGAGTPIGTGGGIGTILNPTSYRTNCTLRAWTENGDDLVTIDTATGVATVVGNSGISTAEHGLAYNDVNGVLYFVNWDGSIYTLNTGTGLATATGNSFGVMAHHGDVDPLQGIYYGIDTTPSYSTELRNLIVGDLATGTLLNTVPTVNNLFTVAFVPDRPPITVADGTLLGTILDAPGDNSTLVEINPGSGDLVRTIGLVGYEVNGLEYNAVNGKLYATTSNNDPTFPDGLLEINMATGAGTPIGSGAGMLVNNPTANSSGQLYGWTEDFDDLVLFNTTSGVATVVGDTGEGYLSWTHGLAFDASNNLFLVNGGQTETNANGEVYTINPATGDATYVGALYEFGHHGDFDPVSGLYFGLENEPCCDGGARRIGVSTVTTTRVRQVASFPTVSNLMTLTFMPRIAPSLKRAYRLFGTILDTVGQDSTLVEIDPQTGALVKTIGMVGYMVNGLEYDPKSNRLFATTSNNDPTFPSGLLEINKSTGAGTPIGSGAGMHVNNPTVNPSGQMYAWTEDSDDPVRVNTTTGAATVVGDTGLGGITYEHGVAFDMQNNLFLVNGEIGDVYTINPLTGAGAYVASIGDHSHHGDFDPGTGLYFGLDTTPYYDNRNYADAKRNIIISSITPSGVKAELVLPTIDNLFTLSFYRKRFSWPMFMPAIEQGGQQP